MSSAPCCAGDAPESGVHLAVPSFDDVQRRRLVRILTSRLRNVPDAEDVAQEAMLDAWRYRHTYDASITDAWSWLLTIALRLAGRYHFRKATRAIPLTYDAPRSTLDDHGGAELHEVIAAGMATLKQAFRLALESTVEDEPYEDLAARLGVSQGALRWRICEARRALRAYLRARGYDVPDELRGAAGRGRARPRALAASRARSCAA